MTRARLLATLAAQVPWTAAQLVVESAALATLARRPARAGERPWGERYERIGPGWLTGVLQGGGALGPGDEVVALTLERIGLIGQMSAVFRVTPTYNRDTAGPRHLVLKTTAAEMKQRVLNSALDVFGGELRALRLPRHERGLLRPRCWYAEQHRVTRSSILLLDDLSSLRSAPADGHFAAADALRVAAALAVQHATWWGRTDLRERGFKTTPELMQATMGPMCELGWGRARKLMAPLVEADILALLDAYVAGYPAVGRRIMAGPLTLLHGDLHSNNLFLDDAAGTVCAIDWQVAHLGHWSEDLAYVASMTMHPEVSQAHEDELLATHRRGLAEHGVVVDEAQHRAEYALGLLQVGATLVVAALIVDPVRSPVVYQQYRDTIRGWGVAARRHRLPALLAEVLR